MRPRVLLIGLGLHARRIHFPLLREVAAGSHISFRGVVDREPAETDVGAFLERSADPAPPLTVAPALTPAGDLDTRTTEALDALVRREGITTVLVATEPLAHCGYAQWALSRSLNVLVDKPPTARTALTTDSGQARAMVGDFAGLVRAAADGCCHAAVLTQLRW